MKEYFIYKYEWDDGSIYIGQSYIGSGRYGHPSRYKKCPRVYNKMKKYPDFNKEILVSGLSETEVDDFEIYYIKVYNSYKGNNPEYGLNLSVGGYGSHGEDHFNYGRKLTEEHKEKISNGGKGKKRSDETKKRLSESKMGEKHPLAKEVHQYTLDGEYITSFPTSSVAERELNIKKDTVRNAANPKHSQKTAGGFKWRYYRVDILEDKEV